MGLIFELLRYKMQHRKSNEMKKSSIKQLKLLEIQV